MADAGLLAEALLTVTTVLLARGLLPTAAVRALLRRTVGRWRRSTGAPRAAWAVDVAARLLPAGACLTRALATEALLARRGQRSRLEIGFRREADGRLAGHAWVAVPVASEVATARPAGGAGRNGGAG